MEAFIKEKSKGGRNLNVIKKNCDANQDVYASLNNIKCGSIYRYLKRKREMETSTPVNRLRESKLIEDQD